MIVSKYKMLLNSTNAEQPRSDKYLTIPVELKWDLLGQDDAIDEYQRQMVKEIIGKPIDYESSRFSNNLYVNTIKSDINYEFYFFNGNPLNLSNSSNWVTSYAPQQFDNGEIYYNAKSFTKSFFKLDLYDTKESKTQINYLTLILPVREGQSDLGSISPILPNVNIKKPTFSLDYFGKSEAYFIYWLKSRDYLNIDTFYMSAKFFNGKTGDFIKMMNKEQGSPQLGNKYSFNPEEYFYYKVKLDYNTLTYEVLTTDIAANRVGEASTPIKWYEYVNPV
jgi:hypothetical protein